MTEEREIVVASWAERYVRVMDEAVRIPGTRVGVGLDPVVGLVLPGAGDLLTGAGSIALLFLALKEGVPTVWILRMILNIGIDTALGAVPLVGDVFDLFFRSNRKNLEIVLRTRSGDKPRLRDYVVVGLGVFLAVFSVLLPVLVFWGVVVGTGLGFGLWRWLGR